MSQNPQTLIDRWHAGDAHILNLAHYCAHTQALGPGTRAVIWVQGCASACQGCVAPSYQVFRTASLYDVEKLAALILEDPAIEGLTVSGGEPFLQARSLANLIDQLHTVRPDLTILSYSGYTLDQLKRSKLPGAREYLSRIDTLIDGPYIQELDDGLIGLRGSTNQVIHHFTERMAHFDFENVVRQPEIRIKDRQLVFVGVPARGFINAIGSAVQEIKDIMPEVVYHVRT